MIDFLKVLRFSFPVPVLGPAFSLAFAAEKKKNLPLALYPREKNLSSTCGQVYANES